MESDAPRKDTPYGRLLEELDRFVGERDWERFHSPKNLAMALSVEVAEIVEHFQWVTEEQSRNFPSEKLAEVREEIGDVMIYLTELADNLSIDPVEAAMAKVSLRLTYGDGTTSTRVTYFVQEDGTWQHRFGQEEYDLFLPELSYEEFVAAQQ